MEEEDAQGPPELPSDEELASMLPRSPIRSTGIWAPQSLQEQLMAATARVLARNGCRGKTCSVTYTDRGSKDCCITW